MLSQAEENYLKAIFKLSEKNPDRPVSTNAIAAMLDTKAASVTDMIKRLSEKELIEYEKYRGVQLSDSGSEKAKNLIRKHRLWEVFLVKKLNFSWDEVHEIAEQLEHIQSPLLTSKLDKFLGYPKYDPHGDPIPDEHGHIRYHEEICLNDLKEGQLGIIVGVKDSSPEFLQYLDHIGLVLGTEVRVTIIYEYDNSKEIFIDNKKKFMISEQVGTNLYVKLKGK